MTESSTAKLTKNAEKFGLQLLGAPKCHKQTSQGAAQRTPLMNRTKKLPNLMKKVGQ